MDNHVMEYIIAIGAIATVATNVLNFLETTRQFKMMRNKGNKILDKLSSLIEEIKD